MLLPIIYFFKKLQYCSWADSWLFLVGVVRKLEQVVKWFQDKFEINLNICIFSQSQFAQERLSCIN